MSLELLDIPVPIFRLLDKHITSFKPFFEFLSILFHLALCFFMRYTLLCFQKQHTIYYQLATYCAYQWDRIFSPGGQRNRSSFIVPRQISWDFDSLPKKENRKKITIFEKKLFDRFLLFLYFCFSNYVVILLLPLSRDKGTYQFFAVS